MAYEINALAHGEPGNEHSGSKDAQVRGASWVCGACVDGGCGPGPRGLITQAGWC